MTLIPYVMLIINSEITYIIYLMLVPRRKGLKYLLFERVSQIGRGVERIHPKNKPIKYEANHC